MFNSWKENWIVQILLVILLAVIWFWVGPKLIQQVRALIDLYSGSFAPITSY